MNNCIQYSIAFLTNFKAVGNKKATFFYMGQKNNVCVTEKHTHSRADLLYETENEVP